jgi:integrase
MAGTIRKRTWVTRRGETKTAWLADYFDQNRHRHTKHFATKRAADAWLLQTRGEVRDGMHTPDSTAATVAEAAQLWLRRAATNNLERGSQRAYEQLVRLAIEPLLGQVRLSRLNRPMVETFRDGLLEQFAYLRARRALGMLKSILDHAHSRGLVAHNVARGVRIDARARLQDRLVVGRTIPTPEEVQRLLAVAPEGWCKVMVLTAAFTGMRMGELRGLGWDDVDLANARLTVRRRADEWGRFGPPKSKAGQRMLTLPPLVVAELRRWKARSPDRVNVFPGQTPGSVIAQASATRAFAKLQRKAGSGAGKPKYVFHALRHFFASVMIGLGYTSKWLQVMMGHENIVLTLGTYGHLFPETGDVAARMAAFEAAVLGKPG